MPCRSFGTNNDRQQITLRHLQSSPPQETKWIADGKVTQWRELQAPRQVSSTSNNDLNEVKHEVSDNAVKALYFFSRNNYHFSGKCIVLHHSIIDSCCIWCYATTKILSKYVLESIVIFALARLLHQVLEREFARVPEYIYGSRSLWNLFSGFANHSTTLKVYP